MGEYYTGEKNVPRLLRLWGPQGGCDCLLLYFIPHINILYIRKINGAEIFY